MRFHIPVPAQGYWNRRHAGKRVAQVALPDRPPGVGEEILIGGGKNRWPRGPSESEIASTPLPSAPSFDEPIEAVRRKVVKKVGRVRISRLLDPIHPDISRLLQEDEDRRKEQRARSYFSSWNAPIFEGAFETRRLTILNTLMLNLARVGAKSSRQGKEGRDITVTVGHTRVCIYLDHSGAKQDRYDQRFIPAPSQQAPLTLRIAHGASHDGGPDTWSDDRGGKLEKKLTEILVEVIVSGEIKYRAEVQHQYEWQVMRKAQAEQELIRRQQEAERQERERLAREEKARIDRLRGEANSFREANEIRGFVEAVVSACVRQNLGFGERLESWAKWAREQADKLDPIANGSFLNSHRDATD